MIELLQLPQPPDQEQIDAFIAWLELWGAFFLKVGAYFIGVMSAIRRFLVYIEPGLVERNPPTPTSTFWAVWVQVVAWVEVFSWSGPRDQFVIRTLHAWNQKRKTLDPAPDPEPETPKGGETDAKK